MGIPRLSQDLYPAAERIALGAPNPCHSGLVANRLVIDGPSLVYFVYSRVFTHNSFKYSTSTTALPSYAEINDALLYLLEDFTEHGIEIECIFFDGALPASKHEIRLERLERSRHQLEVFRKLYPQLTSQSGRFSTNVEQSKIVWNHVALSSRKQSLPAPQLLVASAIEALLLSEWSDRVRVVNGEADSFCAKLCSISGAAILSNDSDLALYELGQDGIIVLLQTIEKQDVPNSDQSVISAEALRPYQMANRLKMQSLLRMGFERENDPSVSSAVIVERAKDVKRGDNLKREFSEFRQQYNLPQEQPSTKLNGLDPRIAELITSSIPQLESNPQIYLPPLLEDPSRDGSWSYGTEIRRMAYSIFQIYTMQNYNQIPVVEFIRRGARIAPTQVQPSSQEGLNARISNLLETLAVFLRPRSSSTSIEPILPWWLFGLHSVCAQKLHNGKSVTESQIFSLFTTRSSSVLSWDHVHLVGNIHAVLYSLRILKQIISFLTTQCNCKLDRPVSTLSMALDSLPLIQDLFLDVERFQTALSKVPSKQLQHDMEPIIELIQPSIAVDSAGIDYISAGLDSTSWAIPKTPQKQKANPIGLATSDKSRTMNNRNIFAMLDTENVDEDEDTDDTSDDENS